MTGACLKAARKKKRLTQKKAAARLSVTQGYLSMLENGRRPLPAQLMIQVMKAYEISPVALPFHGADAMLNIRVDEFAAQLAALGYPGFSYMRTKPKWNPAELLLAALLKDNVESRVTEALPWLALQYVDLDWGWLVRESKLHDVQNRLGFAVTLARELAEHKQNKSAVQKLRAIEEWLEPSVLARTQTFCHEAMSQAERRWLQRKRSARARRWNILSDLSPEHLTHAA
jgi:transcriptional regulator with XRE-family HTH domain